MTTVNRIWVDADACPGPVKEILYRTAERLRLPVVLVANQALQVPASRWVSSRQVTRGLDAADDYIVEAVGDGELVITADIPLAAQLLDKSARVITPRGERYTAENIRQRLNMRDFMDVMRGAGAMTGGPAAFSQRDRQNFANALDQLLTSCGTPRERG